MLLLPGPWGRQPGANKRQAVSSIMPKLWFQAGIFCSIKTKHYPADTVFLCSFGLESYTCMASHGYKQYFWIKLFLFKPPYFYA
ncbi:MAG: hypothetical protein D6730_20805 [Bacteroidetes bacterium]|nr:MAG: hypothetical protein D6730_20805 [Bacteroidota bacterium]